MGVYIDMEMPKNGYDCPMCRDGMCIIPGKDSDGICLSFGPYEEKRPNDCPLTEVPEPHGRLGDLDRLEQMFVDIDNAPYSGFDGTEPFYSAEDAAQIIRLAPTVIPASEEG